MTSHDLAVLSIGSAAPAGSIAQSDAGEAVRAIMRPDPREERALLAIFRRSGVTRRHSVLLPPGDAGTEGALQQGFFPPAVSAEDRGPGTGERMRRYAEHAGPLALRAAREALDASGLDAGAITHVVSVSCTGFAAPGFDVELVRDLDLAPTVARTHVGFMGCHGALNGLRAAHAYCSDPAARVLLCAAELCSLHLQYGWDEGLVVANALFADGAAAAVLAPAHEARPGDTAAGARGGGWRLRKSGSLLFPGTEDAMTWSIGDNGFAMTLSAQVPALIEGGLRPFLSEWLGRSGLALEDVATWAVHPGGPRILDAVEAALGLPREHTAVSREVLASHGNMSSPTLLFILQRLIARDAPRPCVALGFGPGLVAEVALFE